MGYEDMHLLAMLSLAEGLWLGSAEAAESCNSPKIILTGTLIIFTYCILLLWSNSCKAVIKVSF